MDTLLQLLKREAYSDDIDALRRYTAALERLIETGDTGLKLWRVFGWNEKYRFTFMCIAENEDAAKAQFEKGAKDENEGTVLWNHTFESYAGPVDGMEQPLDLLVENGVPLPLQHLTRYTYVLTVSEMSFNTFIEHC